MNIIEMNDGTYKAFVTNSRACAVINKLLKQYPKDIDFEADQSEAIFRFNKNDLTFVKNVMSNLGCLED